MHPGETSAGTSLGPSTDRKGGDCIDRSRWIETQGTIGRGESRVPDWHVARKQRSDARVRTLRIDVTAADRPAAAFAMRQVLLALSRFGAQVRRVTVRLAKAANPLGGFDQRCRMRARLPARDDIQVEAIDATIETAVARAAARLAKRVGWALDGTANDGFRPAPRLRAPNRRRHAGRSPQERREEAVVKRGRRAGAR